MEEEISLPDDTLRKIFVSMTIDQLEQFMMLNPRFFDLGRDIMMEKLMLRENQRKLAIQALILARLRTIRAGYVLDLTDMNVNSGIGARLILPPLTSTRANSRIQIGQYPLFARQDRYNEMADIMNTVPMVPIYHVIL